MEIKEAIEKMRKEKNDPSKPAFLIYSLLHSAHPTVVEIIEHQAATMMIAGENMRKAISDASKTEEGRKKIQAQMDELMSKIKSPSSNNFGDPEDG